MRPRKLAAIALLTLIGGPSVALAQATTAPAMPAPPPAAPGAPASPDGMAPAAPSVDPAIATRAKDWFRRLQTANVDRSQLDDTMNSALTDAELKQVAAEYGPLGEPTTFTFVEKRHIGANTGYRFRATFKAATIDWLFALDDGGKISGLRFVPQH